MYDIDATAFMNAVLLAVLGVAALLVTAAVIGAWAGKRGRTMSYLYMLAGLFGTFAAVVAVLGFRGATSEDRPWHFFLDMKYQAKYTSQGQSKFFADGRSNRLPPADTVPFDGTDYAADAGRHAAPNPDFLKADRRYYLGVANPEAKVKAADGSELPTPPRWEGRKLAGEGYWVNNRWSGPAGGRRYWGAGGCSSTATVRCATGRAGAAGAARWRTGSSAPTG
jgi:hypothetical protein